MIFLITLIWPMTSFAQIKSNLYKKPEIAKLENKKNELSVTPKQRISKKHTVSSEAGNLPSYYQKRNHFVADGSPIVLPTKPQSVLLGKLPSGEVINAYIKESLIAFSEVKAPIRAIITSGQLKGSILLGEATLEKNSKRILVIFNKLISESNYQSWNLQGHALDYKGILGIEGRLVSGEGKYFAAEFLASAAAGYADATISREQTPYGGYVEKPGADTFSKKALASAMSKTADRFSEKLKAVPEYAVLEGPFEFQILITEQPTLNQ